eukprot:TRINITY_DN6_c0_g1_i1.p1 TRINITY_DN6_c0_g1~~TRINITY_DN6_c0_g1_i1.p1  ORF type:complete len:733 (-),score=379.80 TRINITY_DN6_c0_g1_i1:134-2332(-)
MFLKLKQFKKCQTKSFLSNLQFRSINSHTGTQAPLWPSPLKSLKDSNRDPMRFLIGSKSTASSKKNDFELIQRKHRIEKLESFEKSWNNGQILGNISSLRQVVMNRQSHLNALDLDQARGLLLALRSSDALHETNRATILRSAGGIVWCGGTDMRALHAAVVKNDMRYAEDLLREIHKIVHCCYHTDLPFFPLAEGIASGVGAAMFMASAFRTATDNTIIVAPNTSYGFIPEAGLCQLFSRLPKSVGIFMGLTNARMKGNNLYHAGISTHKLPVDFIEYVADDLVENVGFSPQAMINYLSLFDTTSNSYLWSDRIDAIDEWFSGDSLREIYSKLADQVSKVQKTPNAHAHSYLAIQAKTKIDKNSPLATHITCKLMMMGKKKSFEEIAMLSFRAAYRLLKRQDFREGVESLVLQNKIKPTWEHRNVLDISEAEVDSFFEPIPGIPDELLPFKYGRFGYDWRERLVIQDPRSIHIPNEVFTDGFDSPEMRQLLSTERNIPLSKYIPDTTEYTIFAPVLIRNYPGNVGPNSLTSLSIDGLVAGDTRNMGVEMLILVDVEVFPTLIKEPEFISSNPEILKEKIIARLEGQDDTTFQGLAIRDEHNEWMRTNNQDIAGFAAEIESKAGPKAAPRMMGLIYTIPGYCVTFFDWRLITGYEATDEVFQSQVPIRFAFDVSDVTPFFHYSLPPYIEIPPEDFVTMPRSIKLMILLEGSMNPPVMSQRDFEYETLPEMAD